MSNKIPKSNIKELNYLLQKLYHNLKTNFSTVHKGIETISFTDSSVNIVNVATKFFESAKREGETNKIYIDLIISNCTQGNPNKPKLLDFTVTSENLRSIYNDLNAGKRRTIGRNTADVFALYLGFVGWEDFLERQKPISNKRSKVLLDEKPLKSEDKLGFYKVMTKKKVPLLVIALVLLISTIVYFIFSPIHKREKFPDDVNGILVLSIDRDTLGNLQSDLVEVLNKKMDTSLRIEARPSTEKIDIKKGSKSAHEQARNIGLKYNAKIVLWGDYISDKKKFYPYITIIEDQSLEHYVDTEIDMDALFVGNFDVPPILVNKPEVLMTFIKGKMALREHDYKTAIECFSSLEDQHDIEEIDYEKLLMQIGACYSFQSHKENKSQNLYKAEEYFQKTIQKNPNNKEAHNNMVMIMILEKEYEFSLAYSKYIIDNNLVSNTTWSHLGTTYYYLDSLDKAISYFEKTLIQDQNNYHAYSMIGSCYKRMGKYREAINYLNKALKINENDISALYEKGMCYYFLEEYDNANYNLKLTVKKAPHHFKAWTSLSSIYKKTDIRKAIKYWEEIKKIGPPAVGYYFMLGNLYDQNKENDSAIKYYNKAILLDSSNYGPWLGLGLIYSDEGNYRKAVNYLTRALEINDSLYMIWYKLGVCYNNLGKYNKAINSQMKALSIDQNYAPAWLEKGRIFFKQRKFRNAIIDFNTTIRLDSNDYEPYYLKGKAQENLGQSKEALKSFYKAQTLIGNNSVAKLTDVWLHLGSTYLVLKDYKNSENAYLQALKTNPEFSPTNLYLGIVNSILNDKKKSLEYFNKADTLETGSTINLFYKGLIYINLNMLTEAQYCFEQTNLESGGMIIGNVGMGYLSIVNKNWDDAPMYFNEASIVFDTKDEYLSYIKEPAKFIKPELLEDGWHEKLKGMLDLKLRK